MQFGCQQPLLLGGALRDSPKNGCKGDYPPPPSLPLEGQCHAGYNPLTAALKTVAHEGTPSIHKALSKYQPKLSVQEVEMHNYRMHRSNGNFLQQMENFLEVLHFFCSNRSEGTIPFAQNFHFPFCCLLGTSLCHHVHFLIYKLYMYNVPMGLQAWYKWKKKSWKYSIISNQNF